MAPLHCFACGHDLNALAEQDGAAKCPECGAATGRDARARAKRWRNAAWGVWVLGSVVPGLVFWSLLTEVMRGSVWGWLERTQGRPTAIRAGNISLFAAPVAWAACALAAGLISRAWLRRSGMHRAAAVVLTCTLGLVVLGGATWLGSSLLWYAMRGLPPP